MFTIAILAKNAAATLDATLAAVATQADTVVFNDFSIDDTVKIAQKHKVKVIDLPNLPDFSQKRNWIMSNASMPWVFFLDADETISPTHLSTLDQIVSGRNFSAITLTRRDILWGKTMQYGDNVTSLVRIVKKNTGKWVNEVHEVWQADNPSSVTTANVTILHTPITSLYSFLRKLNLYSTLRAQQLYAAHYNPRLIEVIILPLCKFAHLYFIKLGFLDGMPGTISALSMSFYTYLCRSKLWLLYQKNFSH